MERLVALEDVTFAKYKYRHFDTASGQVVYSDSSPFHPVVSHTPFIIFSDLHAHNYSLFNSMTPTGMSQRVLLQAEVLEYIVKMFYDTTLIFLGDLFHLRNHIEVSVYNAIIMALRRSNHYWIPRFLPGNHDISDRAGDIITFGSQDGHTLQIVNQVARCYEEHQGLRLGFIPYCYDLNKFKSILDMHVSNGIDVLFMHQMVNEAQLPNGYSMSSGGLSINDLPQDIPIFSGHVHLAQAKTLSKKSGRLIYCGAVMPQSFADCGVHGSICYFSWYDRDTWSYEIATLNVPQFYVLEATSLDQIHDELEFRSKANYSSADCYRIDYYDDSLLPKLKELIKESGLRHVKYEFLQKVEKPVTERSFDRTKLLTDDEMIDLYVDGNVTSLDRLLLKEVGKKVIKRSRSISHD